MMEKRLLNIKEASEYLGVKENTLYCWVSQKKIPYVKLGRKTLFDIEDLNRFIEENKVKAEWNLNDEKIMV